MARSLFDPQHTLWHWFGKVPEFFCLSFFWLLLCLPVVTIVPATIALYDAIVRKLRPDEKGLFKRFFTTFWKELGRGILMSLFWLVVAAALGYCYYLLTVWAESGGIAATLCLVYQISLLIPIAAFFWSVALEARFVNTFGGILKNALIFTFSYLPRSGLVLVIGAAALLGCWYMPVALVILPAIMLTCQSIPMEKAIKEHLPEE